MSKPILERMIIKGVIADLPEADRTRVHECADKLRTTLKEYGLHGSVALALVGVEAQEEDAS